MPLNKRKENYGATHIKKLNEDVAAVAGRLLAVVTSEDGGTSGERSQQSQITAAWAVFTALGSRWGTLRRKYSALADDLEPIEKQLKKVRSELAAYSRPAQAELLSLIDRVLDSFNREVQLWDVLSGQGALLMLSDGQPRNPSASEAVDDALALIVELRDFIGDIYAEVPIHRLKATMRQVRDMLGEVTD